MIRDVTVYEVVSEAARLWPDGLALTSGDRSWTFTELLAEAHAMAGKMHSLGVGKGDHVAVWAANLPEWIFLEFGLARIGAVLVTVNTAFGSEDLAYLLDHSDAKVLLAGREARGHDFMAVLGAVDRSALPRLEHVVLLEGGEADDAVALDALSNDYDSVPPLDVALDDCINMQYTSGTTGFPKGVMLSSRNIVNNGYRTGKSFGVTPDDRVLCQVPLFHCFGCVVVVLGAYTHGASIHLTRAFDPADSIDTILRHEITAVHGVPTMFHALCVHAKERGVRVETVRSGIMAGASCPPSLVRQVATDLAIPGIAPGFGLTESSPAVTFADPHMDLDRRCHTIGDPVEETEVRLVDPVTGAVGDHGEVHVRGEQVMLGYYKNPEATAATVDDDGWLHTGDLAVRNDQGDLDINGRIKEMIIRGGENVYPAEVEEAMRGLPGIVDVAAFGIPDPVLGETVAVAIVPAEGAAFDTATVKEKLAGRIGKSKIPAAVFSVESLPMTASGKIKRYQLTERFGETS